MRRGETHIEEWLAFAKTLRCGQTVRTPCSSACNNTRSQIVSHNARGFTRHCFACGEHEYKPHGIRSIAQIEQAKRDAEFVEQARQTRLRLPDDITNDLPVPAARWLFSYGITEQLQRKHGITYSPRYDRVCLPVFEDGVLTALQMRAVSALVRPKYLNPDGPQVGSALKYASPDSVDPILQEYCIVITEDILSAIKVGTVTRACSILGTTLTDARLGKLLRSGVRRAFIWLDSDAAGVAGAKRITNKLRQCGVAVTNICTEKDPKCYTREAITQVLKEHTT